MVKYTKFENTKCVGKNYNFMKSINILKRELGEFEFLGYENQNSEYEGMVIQLTSNKKIVRSRLAKKTSKKDGYFVAFWEKNSLNVNCPFTEIDSPEELAILIVDEEKQGIFLIPKEVAVKNKILANKNQKGKMAMRFYPSWCKNLNPTAKKTQSWQIIYFKEC